MLKILYRLKGYKLLIFFYEKFLSLSLTNIFHGQYDLGKCMINSLTNKNYQITYANIEWRSVKELKSALILTYKENGGEVEKKWR